MLECFLGGGRWERRRTAAGPGRTPSLLTPPPSPLPGPCPAHVRAVPTEAECQQVEGLLAGCGADMAAWSYVKRMRRLNLTGKQQPGSASVADGLSGFGGAAQSQLTNLLGTTFGQGLSSLTKGGYGGRGGQGWSGGIRGAAGGVRWAGRRMRVLPRERRAAPPGTRCTPGVAAVASLWPLRPPALPPTPPHLQASRTC